MVENKRILLKFLHPGLVFFTYMFLYLPILIMAIFSFNGSSAYSEWGGFSLRWYYNLFSSPEILDALFVSLVVAFFSSILSLFLGTSFVLASKWWKSTFLSSIFYINIILPDIVLAVCILSLFTFFNISVGYISLISGHTIIGIGFVIPIVRARFIELDPVLTEASLDLGASYAQTFRKVLLPLLAPSLIASVLLVFTISLDDFLIGFFCSSPSVQTLSVYIYSMIKTGVDPTINAVSTLLLVISSLLVLILFSLNVLEKVVSNE